MNLAFPSRHQIESLRSRRDVHQQSESNRRSSTWRTKRATCNDRNMFLSVDSIQTSENWTSVSWTSFRLRRRVHSTFARQPSAMPFKKSSFQLFHSSSEVFAFRLVHPASAASLMIESRRRAKIFNQIDVQRKLPPDTVSADGDGLRSTADWLR